MSIRQKTIRAAGWSSLQGWGSQIIGFTVYAILARLLEPRDFGLVAMASVFIAFTQVFVDQGLSTALVQRRDLLESHKNTMFWTNIGSGVVLMGVGLLAAELVAALYGEPDLVPVLQALSLVLLINSFCSVQTALLRRNLEYRPLAVRSLFGVVTGGVVGVAMALLGYGIWSLVAQQLSSSIVQMVLLWVMSSWRPRVEWSYARFKELFTYGSNVLGINILEFFNRYADNFLIGYFLGPAALGYYALAYKLFQTLTLLISGLIQQVAFSSFSTLQHDPGKIRGAFYSITELAGTVAFPVFLGGAILAPELFVFVFGETWAVSATVFQVLAFVALLESVYVFNGSVMLAMGKPQWRLKLNLLNAVVNVIGFAIAVHYGIVYVALAYVVRSYLLSPLPIWCVRRLIDIDVRHYLLGIGRPMACAVVMAATLYALKISLGSETGFWMLALALISAGLLVYIVCLYLLRPELIKAPLRIVRSLIG